MDRDWEEDLAENKWTASRLVSLSDGAYVSLTGDRYLHGFSFSPTRKGNSTLDLNGYRLVVGSAGLQFTEAYNPTPSIVGNGALTSSSAKLSLSFLHESAHLIRLDIIISDNGTKSVGVDVIGSPREQGHRGTSFGGDKSNAFSGDLNVVGDVKLNLEKQGGAVAVSGQNMTIRDGADVRLLRSFQINKKARVSLMNGSIVAFVDVHERNISEQFRQLVVEGQNLINFDGRYITGKGHGRREIILDDLLITEGSLLNIQGWVADLDYLLVRKDSVHLKDSLGRIHFLGQSQQVHLREYDKDFWEISNLPEPATYGVALTCLTLAVLSFRRSAYGRRR